MCTLLFGCCGGGADNMEYWIQVSPTDYSWPLGIVQRGQNLDINTNLYCGRWLSLYQWLSSLAPCGYLNLLLKKALRLERMVSLPQNRRLPCVHDLLQLILIEANTAISYTDNGQEWRCFLHVEIFIEQKIIFDTGRYQSVSGKIRICG